MSGKHGGKRPGAGRPKGAKTKLTEKALEKAGEGLLPLDYMLKVLRNEEETPANRMDAAKAAAPYVHARLNSVESTVTHKHDVAELDANEIDQLLARELAAREAEEATSERPASTVH